MDKIEATEMSLPIQNTGENAVLEKLSAIESLLKEQNDHNKKIRRGRLVQIILMGVMVLTVFAGMLSLYLTVASVARSVQSVGQELEQVLQEIGTLDFESFNQAISEMEDGFEAMDFDALNESIEEFQKAAEGLSDFLSMFG